MKPKGIKSILERRKRRTFKHKNKVMIGKVVGVHGIKGNVTVKPESDIFERQINILDAIPLWRGRKERQLHVESINPYKQLYIAKFREIDDRDKAEELIGAEIWIDKNKQVELEEDWFYYSELRGCKVFDERGGNIGVVRDILEQPANLILEVEKKSGERVLIPFIEEFVKVVDTSNRRIVISPIEGLV